ncbi:MAG: hypothetical protein K9W46_13855 [Candidatus Heimdallarchaeum endolithica]|uniref:Uncharacterized protein n=1 Tax=Candidatus Heimdallarchaeum endolithica TaxID=2876572 RepID=A0A9Y1BR02_9ARCH|nr:MAG: hypothetical protein K9W46_13855 [Candidatus Heimdallarchaeum endolithica]
MLRMPAKVQQILKFLMYQQVLVIIHITLIIPTIIGEIVIGIKTTFTKIVESMMVGIQEV